MAIKAGQILHSANNFVVDRIQTGGPGNLNIPQDKVYELGNYQSVGIVRDIPDLTFSLDCLDVDTEIEALLTGSVDPGADATSTKYTLGTSKPIDILSPWKSPYGDFAIVRGVAIPNLALESASYRYGLRDNAGEQFSLRGDSIYYVPGTPYQDILAGDGATTVFPFAHTALVYTEGGVTLYALSVTVNGTRMTRGADYTETATGVTFLTAPANLAKISLVYGSATAGSMPQSVHQGLAVKPAAIRGKDIDVFFSTLVSVGGGVTNKALTSNVVTLTTASPHGLALGDSVTIVGVDSTFDGAYTTTTGTTGSTIKYAKVHADVTSAAGTGQARKAVEVRWPDVQSVTVDWKVTLEDDYEFGNARAVARDFADVPAVSGAIEIKPRSVEALFTRLQQITGVPATDIIGPQSSVAGALRIEIRNPESGGSTVVAAGTVLKTHYVPAARFTIPGYEGRVQQKLTTTVNYESDDGVLETYKGPKA
jgi:hypothetical protein